VRVQQRQHGRIERCRSILPARTRIPAPGTRRKLRHAGSRAAAVIAMTAVTPDQDGEPDGTSAHQPRRPAVPAAYTHVVVATGSKTVYIADQEPEDAQGNLVGPGDLAAQADQVFANLGRALAAAGARPGQVARITIYVVHHRPEFLPVIEKACTGLFGDHKPADTVVGVETLARPGYLVEVDAIAVLDGTLPQGG
jgi:enamine deaminase RidA (YjgF/YER057c/UK114 family)